MCTCVRSCWQARNLRLSLCCHPPHIFCRRFTDSREISVPFSARCTWDARRLCRATPAVARWLRAAKYAETAKAPSFPPNSVFPRPHFRDTTVLLLVLPHLGPSSPDDASSILRSAQSSRTTKKSARLIQEVMREEKKVSTCRSIFHHLTSLCWRRGHQTTV